MRSELPRLGHEVTVCPDGRAALKALEKSTFDVAILDLRMPGLTGIEVLEQLKQISPDTEAVVMTGHASMETAIEAIRLGAFDYITKPCKLAEIEAVLAQGRREARPQAQEPGTAKPRSGGRGADRPGGQLAGHGGRPPPHRHGRADRFDGAHPRRNRHRQGTGRAHAVPAKQTGRDAVCAGQLRGLD